MAPVAVSGGPGSVPRGSEPVGLFLVPRRHRLEDRLRCRGVIRLVGEILGRLRGSLGSRSPLCVDANVHVLAVQRIEGGLDLRNGRKRLVLGRFHRGDHLGHRGDVWGRVGNPSLLNIGKINSHDNPPDNQV